MYPSGFIKLTPLKLEFSFLILYYNLICCPNSFAYGFERGKFADI